jgi:hypothetical protein
VQAQGLARALGQRLAVAGEGAKAADVHLPHIGAGLAAHNPFGHQAARAPAVGNARRVEACTHKIVAQLGRFAQDEVAIGREALGAVEQHLDLCRFQAGRAVHGVRHEDFELVPVFVQQLKLEGGGNRVHLPGFGLGFKATHHQSTHFFLVVDEAVGVAHHRQHGVHTFNFAGDDVEMFGREQRHVHPRQPPELPRPLPGTVHQHLAAHVLLDAVVHRAHTHRAATFGDDASDFNAFDDLHAPVARALGQRHAQISRIGLAVARQPDGAGQVIGAHHGVFVARLSRGDFVALHAKAVGQGHLLVQYFHALGRAGHIHAAALLPAGGQARLGL